MYRAAWFFSQRNSGRCLYGEVDKNPDIDDCAIDGRTLAAGVNTTLSAAFTQPAVSSMLDRGCFNYRVPRGIADHGCGWWSLYGFFCDRRDSYGRNQYGCGGKCRSCDFVPTGGAVTLASAVVKNLGYTPVNKAGDTNVGTIQINNDDVVGANSFIQAGIVVTSTSGNANNAGYMPTIGFHRPGIAGRALGLATTGRFTVIDSGNQQGYLLDSVFKVATADVQDKAITLAKLADEVMNLIIPSGIISAFAGPGPPSGWFVCDGSPVSRTTNVKLFAAIGTYWGAGDNVSTFNLPDLRGRVPIGYVSSPASGITARGFASKGGEETHVLSVSD